MPAFAWIKARKKCGQKPHRNKRTNDMNKRTKYMHDTKERDICVLFGIIVDNVDNTFVCVLLLSYEKPVVQANNYIDHDVRRTKRRSTLIFNKNRFPSPKISISFFLLSICSLLVLNVCFWKLYLLFLYHASYRYLKTVNFFQLRSRFFLFVYLTLNLNGDFKCTLIFVPYEKKTCVSQPWNKQNWKQGSSIPFDGHSNSHDKIFVLAICLVCGWCVCLFDFFLSNNIHVYKAIQINFLIHSKITYRNERLCSHMWNFEAHSFDEKILKLATTKQWIEFQAVKYWQWNNKNGCLPNDQRDRKLFTYQWGFKQIDQKIRGKRIIMRETRNHIWLPCLFLKASSSRRSSSRF